MAHQHVQDPAVFERRLRPIYDNLEVGNNRKALQETEKLLKKQPNLLCARALKGLALLRLGRYEESHTFLHAVAEEKPTDDSTLQVLSFCYKEMEQLEKIVELYNHAVKQTPGNEELLAHLFISHVRVEDFKAQHATALQLYKVQPKNAYYFWSVMSVVLQATRGPDSNHPEKRKIYLSLAQRMVDKVIEENKMESEQEAYLYLHILELQEKNREAYNFLNGSICEKVYPGAPVYLKINLMKKLEMWPEIKALLRELLKDDRDRWDYYNDYFTSCFKLLLKADCIKEIDTKNVINECDNDDDATELGILDDCHDFLCQLIESAEKKVRGPYLARLELHKRMREHKLDANALLGEFTELVIEYFRLFGDKSCCTHDIMLFLNSITLAERQELANKLLLESGISSSKLPQNKEQMLRHICALQISRICGSHIDLEAEHLLAFYTALKLHYEHGLSSFGKNLLPTDMGPSDPYALLAANVMYDISLNEQKSDRLFEALCLLQYVLRNSTSNFHVKMLSLKIYHMFGCAVGAQEMYDYLDIKHIQLDSMGYMHCNLLPLCGRFSMARSIFDTTLKFHTNSFKERLEYSTLCYRFCTFSKLEEFMNFKNRLTNSLHYVAISIEAQLCDLIMLYGNVQQNLAVYQNMNIDATDDGISWNELSDNRDLGAVVRWDPIHLIDLDEEKKESFNQEIEVVQIRSLMLRLLASYVDLFYPNYRAIATAVGNASKASSSMAGWRKSTTTTTTQQSANDSRTIAINNSTAMSVAANGEQKSKSSKNGFEDNNDSAANASTEIVTLLYDSWKGLFQRLRLMNYKPLSNRFLVNLLPTRLHLLLDLPYEKFFTDLTQLVLDLYNGVSKLPIQCKIISDNVTNLANICAQTIKESDQAVEDGLWRRREWQSKVAACIEILSLYAFVLSIANEKYQVSTTTAKTKSKKKGGDGGGKAAIVENHVQSEIIAEKERLQLIMELMRHLKHELQNIEKFLQNWKAPQLPRDLNSFMADMSLKPEVEATLIGDVSTTFKEAHELMITELKNVIKDKKRMVSK